MKKVRVIGILTILIIAMNTIFSIEEGVQSFAKGREDAKNSTGMNYELVVSPTTASADTLFNTALNKQLPYQVTQIESYVDTPWWSVIFYPFIFCAALAYFWGFFYLIYLLLAISKKRVFTSKNVFALRFFAYSQGVFYLIVWAFFSILEYYAMQQWQVPGYEIVRGMDTGMDWTLTMITILFAEIFAVGCKIKEEQDLTV